MNVNFIDKFKKIKNRANKWLKQKKNPLSIDSVKIEKEIFHDTHIDKNQIDYWIERFLSNRESIAHPYVEIAQAYTRYGLHENATTFYRRYLQKNRDSRIHGLYLQNLILSQSSTNELLLREHKNWSEIYDNKSNSINWQNNFSKQKKAKLKIGYVCHFFTSSVSNNCLIPFLQRHDKNKYEVFCYDDEGVPSSYYSYADHWRNIKGCSDEKVAEIIKTDGIDILQELNGFCIINRFGALSHRPAPIQVNWYNHAATTGLPYIDYVLSDKIAIPDSDLPFFTEHVYRTDKFISAVNFDQTKFGEISVDPPCFKNGYITFSFFGASHKISQSTIMLWARVLAEVTGSILMLKGSAFDDIHCQSIFKKRFAKYGISENRIIFDGWSDQQSTLQKYNSVDIMLDSIPVGGGSTFFEALMQGVPAITLMGNRWVARNGASVLLTLGRSELVATTQDEYVAAAVKLANNPMNVKQYRESLRPEMLNSSLTNIDHCYRNLDEAYQYMWNRWCES